MLDPTGPAAAAGGVGVVLEGYLALEVGLVLASGIAIGVIGAGLGAVAHWAGLVGHAGFCRIVYAGRGPCENCALGSPPERWSPAASCPNRSSCGEGMESDTQRLVLSMSLGVMSVSVS